MNTFDISGRIGHIEQTGRTLKIAIYTTRVVRGADGPEFKQQRVPLIAFGPKATELAQYAVGQIVKLGGFIRAGKYGIDLVVTRHELTKKVEAQDQPVPEAEIAPEIEAAAEVALKPAAEASKPRDRGRKKAA
jgi:hypothetical protein